MDRTEPDTPPNPAPRSEFRLATLGVAGLCARDGREILGPGVPLAILTYLDAFPGRSASREHLSETFWSSRDTSHARQALRQNLTRLRQLLGPDAFEDRQHELRLVAPLDSDRTDFLRAIETQQFESALALYHGPFFPDYGSPGAAHFEHWVDAERERLRLLFLRAGEMVVRRGLDRGAPTQVLELARRLRQEASEEEAIRRLLLEVLSEAHDQLGARVEAESLRQWLSGEGREPEPSTTRMLRRVASGVDDVEEESPSAPRLVADLVGRDREFHAGIVAWRAAAKGPARHVHIEARAGIGKTRLLRELRSRLHDLGARVVYVRAKPGERHLDGAFIGDLVANLAALRGAAGVSPRSASFLVGLHPSLGSLYVGAPPLHEPGNRPLQEGLAVAELLISVAEEAPVALLLDDLHWSDPTSNRILSTAAARLGQARVLLVSASRHGGAPFALDTETAGLRLSPLTLADTETLLNGLATFSDPGLGSRLAAALQHSAAGSPLLMLETLQLALERGELVRRDSVWCVPDPVRLLERLVSEDAVESRLSTVDPRARRILLLLAVGGVPLKVSEVESAAPPGMNASESLGELERRGFVVARQDRWEVAHDEVADAVIRSVGDSDRRSAHASLGRVLAANSGQDLSLVRRAARHLALGEAEPDLKVVYRRWVRDARRRSDRAPARHLAEDLLGEEASSHRVALLLRSLPVHHRQPFFVAGLSVAGLMVAATGITLALTRRPAVPAEVLLTIFERSDTDSTLRRYVLPLSAKEWAAGDTINATSLRGDEVVPNPVGTFDFVATSPDGKRLVYTRSIQDSGQTDLFLREADGRERRLTSTTGDDIHPSWAPDGGALVFATARWTPPDNSDGDIAILDPTTGRVSQLTRGPDYDQQPNWSPDGTRIGFVRHSAADGLNRLCWVTPDGSLEHCSRRVAAPGLRMVGWRDGYRLLAATERSQGEGPLVELDLERDSSEVRLSAQFTLGNVSADGRYVACRCASDTDSSTAIRIFPISAPNLSRTIRLGPRPVPFWPLSWQSVGGAHWLDHLQIDSTGGRPRVGVSYLLSARGFDRAGSEVPVPGAVLRWRSSDTSVASVEAGTGNLHPHRPGRIVVEVTAGGWRRDSVVVDVSAAWSQDVFAENWRDSSLSAWRLEGTPLPIVAIGPNGVAGLLNNGDQAFQSSVIARSGVPARDGLGIEATVSTPITRDKWQRLKLGLVADPEIANGGVSGRLPCMFVLPTGEGPAFMGQFLVSSGTNASVFLSNKTMQSGNWYRVRLQVFPDATCGVAIDGIPIWRSPTPAQREAVLHAFISGATVGTRLLVGPLNMWRGVRMDVDWDRLVPGKVLLSGPPAQP
jgi:DNA-binding SARP family transcriptional activator